MSAVVPEGQRRAGRLVVACNHCDAAWLAEEGDTCPLCGFGTLQPHSARLEGEPELAIPFALDADAAASRLLDHVDASVMPVADAAAAADRLTPHFVPMWLVDARAVAGFEAEVGFDYEVQSTVERVRGGQWHSVPVTETRIRWEPRAGTLDRWLDNEPVPALSTWTHWVRLLGEPTRKGAVQLRSDAAILLPDQPPEQAWPAAEQGLRQRIGTDVQRATQGQHFRELYLDAVWEDQNWSWLLFPVYAAPYTDHEGRTRMLRVDGVSGRVIGAVAASPGRARFRAGLWASIGGVLLLLSAMVALPGIILWPLLVLTAIGAVLGFVFLGVAVVPLLRVRSANAALPEADPFRAG